MDISGKSPQETLRFLVVGTDQMSLQGMRCRSQRVRNPAIVCEEFHEREREQLAVSKQEPSPRSERKNKPRQVIVNNRQLISKSAKEASLRTLTHALSCKTHIYFLINSSRTERTGLTAPNHQR